MKRTRERPPRLVVFGPLPPPESGVEGMTRLLLDGLADRAGRDLAYRHLDSTVSADVDERERFSWRKLGRVARQMRDSARLALRSDAACYPISQNTTGLARDVLLVAPFWLLRRRRIVHLHGGELPEVLAAQPAPLRLAVRLVFGGPRAHGIALTRGLRPCLAPLVPPERVHVVANAVDAPGPAPQRPPGGPLRVLFLSTLMPRKGYRELILAAQALRERGVDLELVVAGSPFRASDADWIEPHRGWIDMPGHLDQRQKWERLREADVLVLPSTAPEGQPLAIIEGLAAGCAVVATARGGIPDTLSADEGVVLPALDGDALQAELESALEGLAGDRAWLRRMQEAARRRYEAEFRPDRFRDSWLSAVQRSLGSAPRLTVVSHTILARSGDRWLVKNRVGELVEELGAHGWQVTVAGRESAREPFMTHELAPDVAVLPVAPGRAGLGGLLRALRELWRADANLILMPSLMSALLGVLGPRARTVVYAGASWKLRGEPRWRVRLEDRLAACAHVLTSGEALAERFRERGASVTVTVPHVDAEVARGIRDDRPPEKRYDALRLLYVGSLRPDKGTPELARALAALPEVQCRIVGPFAESAGDELRAELERLPNVSIEGYLDWPELRRRYEWATALVLPSHSEGFPRVVHEATAFGAALVLTPVGGIPHVLRHDRDALLVPVGDVEALVAALRSLHERPARIGELAAAAREALRPIFTDPSPGPQFDRILRAAARQPR